MSLFRRLRRLINRPDSGQSRTLPAPQRVRAADYQTSGEQFHHLIDWSTFTPAPPAWSLPDAAEHYQWIDDEISAHAERGTLDGLVPDLLDRQITGKISECVTEIEAAHVQALRQQQELHEQAKIAQTNLATQLSEVRRALAEAERGYERAYEFLTWEKPVRDLDPISVAPTLIRTEIARAAEADEPIEWPEPTALPPLHPDSATEPDDPESPAAALAV